MHINFMHALIDRCILNVCVRGSFGVCFLLYKGNFQMKLFILKLFKFFQICKHNLVVTLARTQSEKFLVRR